MNTNIFSCRKLSIHEADGYLTVRLVVFTKRQIRKIIALLLDEAMGGGLVLPHVWSWMEHAKDRSAVVLRVGPPRTEPLGGPIDRIGDPFLPWPCCSRGARRSCRLQPDDDVLELPAVLQGATLGVGVGGGADEEEDKADADTQKQPHH